MADLDVYEEFLHQVYGILRVNCMYNKGQPVEVKGEDFFKKSKCKLVFYSSFYWPQCFRDPKKLNQKAWRSLYHILPRNCVHACKMVTLRLGRRHQTHQVLSSLRQPPKIGHIIPQIAKFPILQQPHCRRNIESYPWDLEGIWVDFG